MLRVIHSIPDRCVSCQSENVSGISLALQGDGDTIVCNSCGVWMVMDDPPAAEAEGADRGTSSFCRCRHCSSVDAIVEYGGAEICQICGLDPEVAEYSSQDIAHLWKKGSTIRTFLTKNRCSPNSNWGTFLRNFCGPHCEFSDQCTQKAAQFTICFAEHREDIQAILTGQPVKHVEPVQLPQLPKEPATKTSLFMCAAGGWFEKYMKRRSHEGIHTEKYSTGGD